MAKVVFVGHVCLDVICECNFYPEEDSKTGSTTTLNRCLFQFKQRGGNASNNCTIFGILDGKPHFYGTIANSSERSFIENDFQKFGVNTDSAIIVNDCECPNSVIINSLATGSRTIIHCNQNLPEVSLKSFTELDINQYAWIHFEGRNVSNVKDMMVYVQEQNGKGNHKITVSVEIEKCKPELEVLIPLADVVFISKDFALFKGYQSMAETLQRISSSAKSGAKLICPWGEEGASAMVNQEEKKITCCPAYPPKEIVDSVGAGDTFISSTIFSLMCEESLESSIDFGCRVAGAKIGVKGWWAFKELAAELQFIQEIIKKFKKLR